MFVYSLNLRISSNFHRFRSSQTATLTRYKVLQIKQVPRFSKVYTSPHGLQIHPNTTYQLLICTLKVQKSIHFPPTRHRQTWDSPPPNQRPWRQTSCDFSSCETVEGRTSFQKLSEKNTKHISMCVVWKSDTCFHTQWSVLFFCGGFHYGDAQYFWGHVFVCTTSAQVSRRINAGEHLMSAIGLSQSWISLISIPTQKTMYSHNLTHTYPAYPAYPIRTVDVAPDPELVTWLRADLSSSSPDEPTTERSWEDGWNWCGLGVNAWMVDVCGGGGSKHPKIANDLK